LTASRQNKYVKKIPQDIINVGNMLYFTATDWDLQQEGLQSGSKTLKCGSKQVRRECGD